jgi:4-guanidinobutyraldehyde dehydrogenase/NAD-dependent aldehyde dehydrogenase
VALDKDAWVKRALELKPEARMYINGAYVNSVSGKTFDDISPRDQRVIAKIAAGDTEDVNRAVSAAKAAFDSDESTR